MSTYWPQFVIRDSNSNILKRKQRNRLLAAVWQPELALTCLNMLKLLLQQMIFLILILVCPQQETRLSCTCPTLIRISQCSTVIQYLKNYSSSTTRHSLRHRAPVERLFSGGAIVLTTLRNRLSDQLLDWLVTLKIHKKLKTYEMDI